MKFCHILLPAVAAAFLLTCCNDNGNPPMLSLDSEGEIVWEGWTPATLVVGSDTLDARTHFRGGISSGYPKHSMALKLDERYPLCGLPADKDWILNANYIDKTFMRHKLSYDLFRLMNPEKNRAPLCSYIQLTINSEPAGLYVLMQKMDASTLDIVKSDTSSVIFKEPPVFYDTCIIPQDTNNYYQQHFPKKHKEDRSQQAEAIVKFLKYSTDDVFRSQVATLFDLDNIVDWHLLLLLTNNSDGLLKNFFLYKTDDKTPFRIAPWDYDHSYGRDSDNEYNMLTHNVDCNRSTLLRRLLEWDSYRQQLAHRWNNLRESGVISEEAIGQMIDENIKAIGDAVKENEKIWPVDNEVYYDGNHFDEEVAIIRQFIRLNIARLDQMFDFTRKQNK